MQTTQKIHNNTTTKNTKHKKTIQNTHQILKTKHKYKAKYKYKEVQNPIRILTYTKYTQNKNTKIQNTTNNTNNTEYNKSKTKQYITNQYKYRHTRQYQKYKTTRNTKIHKTNDI